MPVDEIREENKVQSDEDTVDRQTSDSLNCNESTVEDDKPNEEEEKNSGVKVSDDVRYDKYFKMKQFGVPAEAVKLKMSSEGLDPSLLE